MSPLFWLSAFFAVAYGLCRWLTRNFEYWREKGVDGPTPTIAFGTILDKMFTPMPELEVAWHRKFGDIYGLFLGNEPMLTVTSPSLIRDILVKDFHNFVDRRHLTTYHEIVNLNLFFVLGEQWKRIRSIVTPSFSTAKLRSMYPLMEECVRNTVEYIERKCSNDGEEGESPVELDMKRILGNMTMDVVAKTAFATVINSNCDDPENNAFLRNAREFFNIKAHRYFASFLLPAWLTKWFLKSQFNEATNEFFIETSRKIIQHRRKEAEKGVRRNDLISLLMEAEEVVEEEESADEDGKSEEKKMIVKKQKLTESEILAQCWVVFLAGYETTSSVCSFAIYELALNSDLQERLFTELHQATSGGTDFAFERLQPLPLLEATINETLRKYPPLIRLERTAAQEYCLEGTSPLITLAKGMVVEISIYAVHHCAKNYPEPEKFDPERFMPENKAKIKPYTFIPFGAGKRNCIGLKFAMMEIKCALAKLVCAFRFAASEKTVVPMKFNTITPFLATNSNYLAVEKRHS